MLCAKGHESSETDFCSVCGVRIGTAAQQETCPDCSLARGPDGGNFCEFCGYNFSTGVSGALKGKKLETATRAWEVVIEVDAGLRSEESPQAPIDVLSRRIRITAESSLIGRTSEKRGIFPEIALDADDAVSHRHALLNRLPDGGLVLRDIESANGTRLNGAEVRPLTDVGVKAGDQITLGHWTRIKVESVPDD